MALLQNETYIKISSISIDYDKGTAEVSTQHYPTQELRQTAKSKLSMISAFNFKAYKAVMDMHAQVIEEQEKAGLTSENAYTIFSKNTKLKTFIDKFNAIYKEYGVLRTYLGRFKIEKTSLQYLSFWESLGLTDELCQPLPSYGQVSFSIQVPEKTDLSSIYPIVKQTLPNAIDC